MKRFTLLLITIFAICSNGLYSQTTDAVSMGAGYANDVFYSFENGEVKAEPRTNWDIGFYTTVWSAGIIINDGNGVALYNYPDADTSAWMTMDTSGISSWEPIYNSEESWEEGAFNRFAKNHPDYGWGVYNPVTHDVEGDSLFFLKLSSGIYKKIWIQKKNSINNTYYFKYADLDNSNETSVVLNCNNYTAKNFAYYSLENNTELDREPDTASWDIVFTKYQGVQPNGMYFPVTGAVNNLKVYANKFYPVADDFEDYQTQPFDSTKTAIGWNWKYFDMGSFQYFIEDSTAFFVNNRSNDVYKLVFTDFAGSSSGDIVFTKKKISVQGIEDMDGKAAELGLYPNPATDMLSISADFNDKGVVSINILSMSGTLVYESEIRAGNTITIPVSGWTKGVYMVVAVQGSNVYREKLIIR